MDVGRNFWAHSFLDSCGVLLCVGYPALLGEQVEMRAKSDLMACYQVNVLELLLSFFF